MKALYSSMVALAAAAFLPSCAELQGLSDSLFEGSIEVPNARVTHASPVKERAGASDLGFNSKSKTVGKFDQAMGKGGKYQDVKVSGGGYNVSGSVDYSGTTIKTGMKGILKVGKKTKEFKSFEPSL